MDKKLIKRAAETAGVFVITFIIAFFNIFGSIDKLLQDKLYQIPRQPDSKIKIIAIDDKSLSELGPLIAGAEKITHGLSKLSAITPPLFP